MEIITLQQTKEYLRIDHNEEDTFIQLCVDQAQQYLSDAIDNFDEKLVQPKFVEKCKIPMLLLVQTMYDNRSFATKDEEKINFIVSSFMLQLQYCYDVEA